MLNYSTSDEIKSKVSNLRQYFSTGITKEIPFRIHQLNLLEKAILQYQTKIEEALWLDLHKSPEESFLTEVSIVLQEIRNHKKNIRKWAKRKHKPSPLFLLPSSSSIITEPLGVSLIIAPWNYPFQLLINSLVGAVSSGCCALLKPSPETPRVARVMEDMITEHFDPSYICMVQGGREVNTLLLAQRFDFIFFTGSPMLGKVVMEAAAKHLTPLVLELGGKSPCIVDKEAHLEYAAKRIVWGKLINAGQTCIAPDYLLVHKDVKEKLIRLMISQIREMYGEDIRNSRFFPRIVSDRAMNRLLGLMKNGKIIYGGASDSAERFIEPTLIQEVDWDDPVMQEEIFGPILPILSFESIDQALQEINLREKPLAFYYFGKSAKAREVLARSTSGGACINDTLMHITNHHLPFGGVGNSGLGKYHGKSSFLAFSNQRGVVQTPTWIDLPLKYVPFKYFSFIKRIL